MSEMPHGQIEDMEAARAMAYAEMGYRNTLLSSIDLPPKTRDSVLWHAGAAAARAFMQTTGEKPAPYANLGTHPQVEYIEAGPLRLPLVWDQPAITKEVLAQFAEFRNLPPSGGLHKRLWSILRREADNATVTPERLALADLPRPPVLPDLIPLEDQRTGLAGVSLKSLYNVLRYTYQDQGYTGGGYYRNFGPRVRSVGADFVNTTGLFPQRIPLLGEDSSSDPASL